MIYGPIDFELERHQNAKLYLLINKLGKEGWKMKIVTWVLMALVSMVVIGAGFAKLSGVEMTLVSFATLGLPVWFGKFIGVAEVAGGIGLWHRKTSSLAAAGLSVIMFGAVYYHVVYTPISEAIPALVILLICAWILKRKGTGVIG